MRAEKGQKTNRFHLKLWLIQVYFVFLQNNTNFKDSQGNIKPKIELKTKDYGIKD